MFSSFNNPAKAYAKVGIETGVLSANPHQLIVMLFEGALLAISNAKMHMQRKQIAEKGQAISRAMDIIILGLKASLDMEVGGDLPAQLDALYDYMCTRLLYANVTNDEAVLDEVSSLLNKIKSAWEEIANNPAVVNAQRSAA